MPVFSAMGRILLMKANGSANSSQLGSKTGHSGGGTNSSGRGWVIVLVGDQCEEKTGSVKSRSRSVQSSPYSGGFPLLKQPASTLTLSLTHTLQLTPKPSCDEVAYTSASKTSPAATQENRRLSFKKRLNALEKSP